MLAAYPNAGIRLGFAVYLKAGGGWPAGDYNVDKLDIGFTIDAIRHRVELRTRDSLHRNMLLGCVNAATHMAAPARQPPRKRSRPPSISIRRGSVII